MADELTSLRTMASILPPFFLVVAAFLLNVSLSRLVATERSNIGLLKSFGYGTGAIAMTTPSSRWCSVSSARSWAWPVDGWWAITSAASMPRSTGFPDCTSMPVPACT
ncbi:MAG: hypothetical protein IPM70_09090 [Proteobacteria bacterium]|nr:hypothetical protein [Pseudomonadota bacterium]